MEKDLSISLIVSVIIPTYQHGETLPSCLESVFLQTLKEIEVIVVDDGSTDNTSDVLKTYKGRIKAIREQHAGAAAARNRGFAESKGVFLFFCDADVVLEPQAFQKLHRTLKDNPDASYAYSSFRFGWKVMSSHEFSPELLRDHNYISTMSLIRREQFPSFDEKLKKFQDWDLWLTMLEQGHTGVWVPEVLFTAIPRKTGMSQWLPSFAYRIPWDRFGIRIPSIERYREAERIIREKHKI